MENDTKDIHKQLDEIQELDENGFRKGYNVKKETVAKTEPQQPSNTSSDSSSLSADVNKGMPPTEPNGEPTVSTGKDTDSESK